MQSMLSETIPIDFDDIADDGADYLEHHGIKGQSWGKRRYQYENGSLTEEGRVHYGVGPARKLGGAVKDAIRKRVNPTNEELDERIARQNAKNEAKLAKIEKKRELQEAKDAVANRKMELKLEKAMAKEERQKQQEYIDKINGKKKDPDKMSDRELQDEFMRLQKERQIRDLDKDLHQGTVSKFMDDYVKTGVGEGLKRGISNSIDKRVTRAVGGDSKEYALKTAENALKLDILKGDKETADKARQRLYELDDRGKNSNKKESVSDKLKEEKDRLQYNVLTGDEKTSNDAADKLRKLSSATSKPKGGNNNDSNDTSESKPKSDKKQKPDKQSQPEPKDDSSNPMTYTYEEFKARAKEHSRNTYESFLEDQRNKTLEELGIR